MEFGIFDHLDRGSQPLRDYYADRLAFVAACDRAGFHGYHLAEHHATPLGMAPSPSVFLAAAAERTRTIRLGPMVFALPLYNPLRLIEEICMLDQMSGGRLDLGFGKGASPIELAFFGADPERARDMYDEAYALILKALAEGRVDHRGTYYRFDDVPLALEPLQRPHPPIWYGAHAPDSAARAGRLGAHIISLDTAAETRVLALRFRAALRETFGAGAPARKIGLGRFVVVADTDEAADAIARRAYPVWRRSFNFLFDRTGTVPSHPRPATWDGLLEEGRGVAGAPERVIRYWRREIAESSIDYPIAQIAFGDMSRSEMLRSVDLFAGAVMPALRGDA